LRTPAAKHPGAAGADRRLYDMLRRQMADGALSAGDRVPSTRALATEFGVSRTTVTAIYDCFDPIHNSSPK